MHTLECSLPHPELRAFVRAYAQRRIYDLDAPIVEPVPARLEQVIEFPLQNVVEVIYWDGRRKRHSQATIIGLQKHANSHAILRDKSESFGIFFQPAGISQLFGIPMRDLCDRVTTGQLALRDLDAMTDEAVVGALTGVKGIGRWTAEMFLMFRLHRPDVLPIGDLGIIKAVQRAYGMRKVPSPERLTKLGEQWRPYRSVACWYLWASLDNKP